MLTAVSSSFGLIGSSKYDIVIRAGLFKGGLNLKSKKYSNNCSSMEKITVPLKYCSDFPREKLVKPLITAQILPCKTRTWVKNLTLG